MGEESEYYQSAAIDAWDGDPDTDPLASLPAQPFRPDPFERSADALNRIAAALESLNAKLDALTSRGREPEGGDALMNPELEQLKRLVDAGGFLIANNGNDGDHRSVQLWRRGDRYCIGDKHTFTYDFDPAYQVWAELAEKLVEVEP